jgi:hypothetical protein
MNDSAGPSPLTEDALAAHTAALEAHTEQNSQEEKCSDDTEEARHHQSAKSSGMRVGSKLGELENWIEETTPRWYRAQHN